MNERHPTVLFLSADVVGSTEYKEHLAVSRGIAWVDAFREFFRQFPLILMGQLGLSFMRQRGGDRRKRAREQLPDIRVWKVGGDEILFACECGAADVAALVVEAMASSVEAAEARFNSEWGFRLHACCWAASFDGRNVTLAIPEMGGRSEGEYVDYLGPDVDAGFRLSKYGSAGDTVVAVDLAEAIAPTLERRGWCFVLQGEGVLKGLFHNHPYPVLMLKNESAVLAEGGEPCDAPDEANRFRETVSGHGEGTLPRLEFEQ